MKPVRNESDLQLSVSKLAKTLLLNFYAVIRFQPFQFCPQTPWQKVIAAEGEKKHPLRE